MAAATPYATKHFTYKPLEPGQIRILQLAPGNKGDTLVGELLIADFDERFIQYDALSYMWGDPAPADTIIIASKALPIASNLTNALNHLRYADNPLAIWIDAICINQDDIKERGEQVQLMRKVYTGAETVRIWINEPGIDSNSEAVKALQHFYKFSDDHDDGQRGLGADPEFWEPVGPLFRNKYWCRAWIQQEVLNAGQLSLHCMDIIIPGKSIAQFQDAIHTRLTVVENFGTKSSVAWYEQLQSMVPQGSPAACDLIDYRDGARLWKLHELMLDNLDVSVPQDKVYAIMHLAADYKDGGIVVDYSKGLLDVVIDAAAYHILAHRDLKFLSYASLVDNIVTSDHSWQSQHHPTWLPRSWCGDQGQGQERMVYDALPKAMQTRCLPNPILVTARRLRIRGILVDHVRSCLNLGFQEPHFTAWQFWSSSLGLYLRVFAGLDMKGLSFHTYKVLIDFNRGLIRQYRDWLMHSFQIQELDISEESQHSPKERNDEQLTLELYQASISGLSIFFNMARDPRFAGEHIRHGDRVNSALLDRVKSTSHFALCTVLSHLTEKLIIMTESQSLGRIPRCAVKAGDEIWMVLGCDVPVILRPQPNGRYWHVCCAVIPALQEHKDLEGFSSDVQPGHKIGDWTVGDVDIE